jgi:hypothetical protein
LRHCLFNYVVYASFHRHYATKKTPQGSAAADAIAILSAPAAINSVIAHATPFPPGYGHYAEGILRRHAAVATPAINSRRHYQACLYYSPANIASLLIIVDITLFT